MTAKRRDTERIYPVMTISDMDDFLDNEDDEVVSDSKNAFERKKFFGPTPIIADPDNDPIFRSSATNLVKATDRDASFVEENELNVDSEDHALNIASIEGEDPNWSELENYEEDELSGLPDLNTDYLYSGTPKRRVGMLAHDEGERRKSTDSQENVSDIDENASLPVLGDSEKDDWSEDETASSYDEELRDEHEYGKNLIHEGDFTNSSGDPLPELDDALVVDRRASRYDEDDFSQNDFGDLVGPDSLDSIVENSKSSESSADAIEDYDEFADDDAFSPVELNSSVGDSDEDDEEDGLDDEDDMFGDDIESVLRSAQAAKAAAENVEIEDDDDAYYSYMEDETEEDPFAGFRVNDVLSLAIKMGASDVHIKPDMPVSFTILGEIEHQPQLPIPMGSILDRVLRSMIMEEPYDDFLKDLTLDTSYIIREGEYANRRFRLNASRTFGDVTMTMRLISDEIPTPEDLGIEGKLLSWVNMPNGLVMINGPTGSGKSTSIASMIRQIQLNRPHKIITLEKPIEYLFPNDGRGLIVQKEVGRDARSFARGLDSAMREAPNIIVVGEVRNRIETNELIRAAETGHLAISTMHTVSPAQTLERIVALYEGDDQRRVLSSLSSITRGFANQALVRTVDEKSRIAIREILEVNAEVSEMISRGDVRGIQQYQLDRGAAMEQQLVRAVKEGIVTVARAMEKSADPILFDKLMSEKQ